MKMNCMKDRGINQSGTLKGCRCRGDIWGDRCGDIWGDHRGSGGRQSVYSCVN